MVTVFPLTVATLVFPLVYTNAPVELEDGSVSANVPPCRYVFGEIAKLNNVGVAFEMTSDASTVPCI